MLTEALCIASATKIKFSVKVFERFEAQIDLREVTSDQPMKHKAVVLKPVNNIKCPTCFVYM